MSTPNGYQILAGSEHPPHPETKRLTSADADEIVTIQIIVRRRPDGPPLKDLDYFQKVPIGSRKLPTRQEFEEVHGATQSDLDAVQEFCRSHDLEVTEANRSRRWVVARGTVAQMNSAFAVELIDFESPHGKYHGFDGAANVPDALADLVEAVNGLDSRPIPSRRLGADPSPIGFLTPPQVAGLYDFPPGTGQGQTIGTYQDPGYGYTLFDVTTTLSNWNVTQTGNLTAFPPESNSGVSDIETIIDITVAAAIAPAADMVAYFCQGQTAADIISTLQSMIHPTGSDPVPTIIIICYAWGAADDETSFISAQQYKHISQLFQDAANLLVTVLTGSADTGAYIDNPAAHAQTVYPGTDPYILCCGGTTIGNIQSSSFEEYVWNDKYLIPPQSGPGPDIEWAGATGGGISARFPVPPYQAAITLPLSLNSTGFAGRGIPDVAGNASPNSGYKMTIGGSQYPPGLAQGGTSIVAPLYAGLVARINASLNKQVGFLNPLIYELGSSICRDVTGAAGPTNNTYSNPVASPPVPTVAGYTAGPGWDACTGWGSINGGNLYSALQSLFPRAVTLVLQRSTYGKDEVTSLLGAGTSYPYTDALYVQVDGFFPAQFGLSASNLSNPPMLSTWLTFSGSFITGLASSGVTLVFDTSTGVQLEEPANPYLVQRITFPFNVQFEMVEGQLQAFNGVPASPGFADYSLTASISSTFANPGSTPVSATSGAAEIQLVLQADPYMIAGETWWLSNDIRVFTVSPNTLAPNQPPLEYSTTTWPGDPNTYIQNLIGEINNSAAFTDPATVNTPFTGISTAESSETTSLALTFDPANPVYNFGLARVHLQGDSTADPVRVFFRLFISPSPDTDFDSTTTFRSAAQTDSSGNPIAGTLIPLLGFPNSGMMTSTIPFFAEKRIDAPLTEALTRQSDPSNAFPISNPTDSGVDAYFGCYLDLNQPTDQFPLDPETAVSPTGALSPDGPWTAAEILSIPAIIMSQHACLVAEIAYDPDPIPTGANAATSDKIGQRNLSWGGADTTFFDVRRTSPSLPTSLLPDELMIEWGNVPIGSIASIYWPGVGADEVLGLAKRFYRNSQLRKSDDHMIQCVTGSITYIPIPAGTGPNLAGLLTVELPKTVKTGELFSAVVRRLSWRFADLHLRKDASDWRYVVGAFQLNIAVRAKKDLLRAEENILALYKWKIEQIPATNRWHPVMRRYIARVSGLIRRLGGNPGAIGPSQTGGATGSKPAPAERREYTGKVMGLAYDRFGDFEGFLLLTEAGEEVSFLAREQAIEDRVREAWKDRMVISVFVEPRHVRIPVLILLRRDPRQ